MQERAKTAEVFNQAFLESRSREVVESAILALSRYPSGSLPLDWPRVHPLLPRGLRDPAPEESVEALHQASLTLLCAMEEDGLPWTLAMTNEMIAANGLLKLVRWMDEEARCEQALIVGVMIARAR